MKGTRYSSVLLVMMDSSINRESIAAAKNVIQTSKNVFDGVEKIVFIFFVTYLSNVSFFLHLRLFNQFTREVFMLFKNEIIYYWNMLSKNEKFKVHKSTVIQK